MSEINGTAVVAGVGNGLGAALCRRLVEADYRVAGLARGEASAAALAEELNREGHRFEGLTCDLTDPTSVEDAIRRAEKRFGPVSVYIHNAARLHIAPFLDTPSEEFEAVWRTVCQGAVHGAQRVIPGMLEHGGGTLLFTGATAAVKAGGGFSAFASAKFALRGLAQSLAREFGPQGVHVVHVLIDGLIWGEQARDRFGAEERACLSPDAVAQVYLDLIRQPRSAWTHELDLRPDAEPF